MKHLSGFHKIDDFWCWKRTVASNVGQSRDEEDVRTQGDAGEGE